MFLQIRRDLVLDTQIYLSRRMTPHWSANRIGKRKWIPTREIFLMVLWSAVFNGIKFDGDIVVKFRRDCVFHACSVQSSPNSDQIHVQPAPELTIILLGSSKHKKNHNKRISGVDKRVHNSSLYLDLHTNFKCFSFFILRTF